MGWGLLRIRSSFTKQSVQEFLPTGQRERYNVDLSCLLHPPQQPQNEQEQFQSRVSTDLRATSARWEFCTDKAARRVAEVSGLGGGKRAMKSVHRRALRLVGEYVLVSSTDRLG
jgi:hypothetical protein